MVPETIVVKQVEQLLMNSQKKCRKTIFREKIQTNLGPNGLALYTSVSGPERNFLDMKYHFLDINHHKSFLRTFLKVTTA